MARYVKSGTVNTVQEINSELEKIATAQDEFLTRNGETPNEMKAPLDMNSNRILNTPSPTLPSDLVRLSDLESLGGSNNTIIFDNKVKAFNTFTEIKNETFQAGDIVVTYGYEEIGDCPQRNHIVKTVAQHRLDIGVSDWQPLGRLDALLEGKTTPASETDLVAIFKSTNGRITTRQCGSPYGASPSLTRLALAEGASRDNLEIVFDDADYQLASTNHDGDLFGRPINLNGNITRFSAGNTGGLQNGFLKLQDTWGDLQTRIRHVDAIYQANQSNIKSEKRWFFEVIESDINAVSGGLINTFRKCEKSKYWVVESIITQNPSGIATSIDNDCQAWRVGTLSMADFVQAYKYETSATNGTVINSSAPAIGDGNAKTPIPFKQVGTQGDYLEYTLTGAEKEVGILLIYTGSGTLDAHIEIKDINGIVVNETQVSNKSSIKQDEPLVVSLNNPLVGEALTIRVTNRTAVVGSGFLRVAGVGCIVDGQITGFEYDTISYSLFTTGDNKVRTFFNGAQNYAIFESEAGVFGGESHGGETASFQQFLVDGEPLTISNGLKGTCKELSINQETQTLFRVGVFYDTKSQHKFTSYPAAHSFDSSHRFSEGFTSKIAYGGMLTTHSQMNKMVLPELIDSSTHGFPTDGSEKRYEFGKTNYTRIESTLNPFINEMWVNLHGGIYNESTPWWKIGINENDARKFYYGPVSSSCCGEKDLSKQPYGTSTVRVYN